MATANGLQNDCSPIQLKNQLASMELLRARYVFVNSDV